MPLKRRPLERDTGVLRDATLVVIASEDTHAVRHYFSRFRPRRVQFVVLQTEDGQSAPRAVVDRLDSFRQEYVTEEGDQLWYCGDTDHWIEPRHVANLHATISHCHANDYRVALSNPCFELWLLLHFSDLVSASGDSCASVEAELKRVAGGYSKRNGCAAAITSDMVTAAIRRAKALEKSDDPIPRSPMTRVFLILEELLRRNLITIPTAS